MEFVLLKEEEFTEFESHHKFDSFYQTVKWGKLKEKNGWKPFFLGVKLDNKVIGAALILKKHVLGKLSILYSPRGYLIDYNNYKLLKFFTINIKKFAKQEHAIFIKIDPYIINKERDKFGEIVKEGIDNSNIINNLKKLKYIHTGFNKEGNLQPQYAFSLSLKHKSLEEIFDNMEPTTKSRIKKLESSGVKCRNINIDELYKFTNIMKDTSIRRGFIDRPYEYYKNMFEIFNKDINILISEIDLKNYINSLTIELNLVKKSIDKNMLKLKDENINEKKINNQIKESKILLDSIDKKLSHAVKLKDENGDILLLGGLLFMHHNKEILSLFGGAFGEYRDFMAAYEMNYEMIKYAKKNGYEKYNFYGISEFKNKDDPMYGLYDFKRGFGGNIEEYIGEFNLVISKFWYFVYTVIYNKIYLKIKKF